MQAIISNTSPFCGWCKGAHCPQDCAKLKSVKCRNCGEKGHIDRFCEIAKIKREKETAVMESKKAVAALDSERLPNTCEITFCDAFYRKKVRESIAEKQVRDEYGYTQKERANYLDRVFGIADQLIELKELSAEELTCITVAVINRGKEAVSMLLSSTVLIEETLLEIYAEQLDAEDMEQDPEQDL